MKKVKKTMTPYDLPQRQNRTTGMPGQIGSKEKTEERGRGNRAYITALPRLPRCGLGRTCGELRKGGASVSLRLDQGRAGSGEGNDLGDRPGVRTLVRGLGLVSDTKNETTKKSNPGMTMMVSAGTAKKRSVRASKTA